MKSLVPSLKWVKIRCTCLPKLVVIELMEEEMPVTVSNCIWISQKKLSSFTLYGILRDFKISDTDEFPEKAELEENEENDNCKALCSASKKCLLCSFKTYKPSTFCKDQ